MTISSRTLFRVLLVSACLVCLTAGGQADELRVFPPEIAIFGPKAEQQLVVVEQLGDLTVVGDRTQQSTFTVSDPKIITVVGDRVQAVADGEATITAKSGTRSATAKVRVTGVKAAPAPTFRNHVLPVLTRAGCNSGACHGALAGKGGFKLSLRGYDPETDHFTMTRQALSRRVDGTASEKSLLLLKATRELPHGGGRRFETDTREYEILRDWIKAGASPPQQADARLQRLEVLPPAATLKPKDTLRVIVRAWYTDGSVEDVTRWARFASSEDSTATINDEGKITVAGHGEAAMNVGFGTLVGAMTVTSPYPTPRPESIFSDAAKVNYIDEHVIRKLKQLRIPPSGPCSDSEFIRRAYLDAAGILPTAGEVEKFLADQSADKRAKLIDRLLNRPEFVDYWTYKWSDLLLVSTRRLPQPAMWSFYRSIRASVADNKPWNQFARELLTATGGTLDNGFGNYFVLHKDVAELTESTAVTFLGTSVTCARCHNHPMEKWTQDQYWSLANLFSRVGLKNGDRPGDVVVHALASGDVLHPRRNIAMPPTPLDGGAISLDSTADRRVAFVNWLTAKENPYFAKALVNRVWRNFMGRGLVEPEDDLRDTNPPTHPELLTALANDFSSHQYDVQHLIRTIMNSATYQRSSKPLPSNASDDRWYSRYLIRRMPAEVLLDALSQVTNVPTPFNQIYTGVEGGTAATNNYPMGTRAVQLPDSRVASRFLDAFGRPDRTAVCSCERQQDATVGQALMLNNGQVLNDKLRAKNSRIHEWLETKMGNEEVVKRAFLVALARKPTDVELKKCLMIFEGVPLDKTDQRREALEDLFWAILTTNEFVFNH